MDLLNLTRNIVESAWRDAFRLKNVKHDENFFELGGHSLTAAKIVSNLGKHYKVKISLSDVFNFPTIDAIAREIENGLNRDGKVLSLQRSDRSLHHPLSLAQMRLWFLYKLRPDVPLYSIPIGMRISGDVDIKSLRLVLNGLMKRHEGLRTKVKVIEGQAFQEILPDLTQFPLQVELIEDEGIAARVNHEISKSFNLEQEVLCRGLLLHLSDKEWILFFIFHHIIFDDWSMDVFIRDLSNYYRLIKNGGIFEFESLQLQYVDFSFSQNNLINSSYVNDQLCYWKKKLSNLTPVQLPLDFARPNLLKYQGNTIKRKSSNELFVSIKEFSQQRAVSLFIFLLACFKWTLSLFTRSGDIISGSPVSNRPFSDQKEVIGYFVNTLVFRTIFSNKEAFSEVLEKVKNTVLESYDAQDVPFEKIVSELNIPRELNKNPLFQVMFSIAYESEIAFPQLDGVEVTSMDIPLGFSKFDLSLHVVIRGDIAEFNFEYLSELFKPSSIEVFADLYFCILENVIWEPGITLSELQIKEGFQLPNGIAEEKPQTNSETTLDRALQLHLEKDLSMIWIQLLKKEEIGFEDNFFELGGNSLLTVQMCDLVSTSLNIPINVIDVFQYPTIKSLARFCANKNYSRIHREKSNARKNNFSKSLQRYSKLL
jgi:acyl carrier protein